MEISRKKIIRRAVREFSFLCSPSFSLMAMMSYIKFNSFLWDQAIMFIWARLARLRRNLSMAQVAERATCSEVTLCKVEKGLPTVSIGIYLRVLYALPLDDDILLLAKDDKLGKALQDMGLKNRQRATKKG